MNKKTIRNAVVLTLAAIILVTGSVLTTMAYLLSSAKVSNVFTIGNVAIEMFESPVTPEGEYVDGFNPETQRKTADTNSYRLVPGSTYTKDPTIYIKQGSEPSLLFAKIKNQITNLEVDPADETTMTMREQMEKNGWIRIGQGKKNGDWIYLFTGSKTPIEKNITSIDYFNNLVKVVPYAIEEVEVDLFENFTLSDNCNLHEDYSQAPSFEVTITAYAIQDTNFKSGENEFLSLEEILNAWNEIPAHNSNEVGNEFDIDTMKDFLEAHYVVAPAAAEAQN
ncbi:MAG: hypothetical protein IKK13_02360 [Clostridia bacterium]|nr:hypothetical protein [Clostridia bacterium]